MISFLLSPEVDFVGDVLFNLFGCFHCIALSIASSRVGAKYSTNRNSV